MMPGDVLWSFKELPKHDHLRLPKKEMMMLIKKEYQAICLCTWTPRRKKVSDTLAYLKYA